MDLLKVEAPADVELKPPNLEQQLDDWTFADSPASTPPTSPRSRSPSSDFDEDTYDRIEDLYAIRDNSPLDIRRAMADDFREGRLETFVGQPQKELPGTKDAYVSYLVTTKVGTRTYPAPVVTTTSA